jgi:hypothetical protein
MRALVGAKVVVLRKLDPEGMLNGGIELVPKNKTYNGSIAAARWF